MDNTKASHEATPKQAQRGYIDPDAGKSESARQASPIASPPQRCIEEHLQRASVSQPKR
jgi:hypothetical protein